MEKLKICVYAICKNESKHIDRWINSLKEADKIVVLDTGSTDDSVSKLRAYEPLVSVYEEKIEPWRFDTARNKALSYIPKDIDICFVSDLDQVIRPGWAEVLRSAFSQGYNNVHGRVITYYKTTDTRVDEMLSDNVHSNDPHWKWERPVHERLYYDGDQNNVHTYLTEDFVIEHHPDEEKDRSQYTELLEQEQAEHPDDPLAYIYYALDLMKNGRQREAIKPFLDIAHNWKDSYPISWLYSVYLNLATIYFRFGDYTTALGYTRAAEETGETSKVLYSTFYYIYKEMGDKEKAYEYAMKCVQKECPILDWRESSDLVHGGDLAILSDYFINMEGNNEKGMILAYAAQKKNKSSLARIL